MKMRHASRSLEPVDSDIGPSKPGILYIFPSGPLHSHILWYMKARAVQIVTDWVPGKVFLCSIARFSIHFKPPTS